MRREWIEKDYYAVLGVDKEASDKEIRKAYRKLAQQYHPDANPGDTAAEERFKEINEANEVLGDKEQRRQYDEVREMGPFVGGPGGTTQHIRIEDMGDMFGGDSPFSAFGGLSDLFGGQGRRRTPPTRGPDLTTDIGLTFHEALNGTVKQISANGKRTKVKFPAGVANGAKIRVKGRGAPGRDGGTAGDLFVRVQVADHPLFQRSGSKLTITVPVTFTEAALGADIHVPTLDGSVTLRVPPGTGSGKKFRVREQGFTKTAGGRGDLLVTVEVVVPDDLSAEEEKLLVELSEHGKDRNPRSHLGV